MTKKISLAALESYVNDLLMIHAFDEKAYNGVQVASLQPITKIATAVSISLEVIQKTIDLKAQALIALIMQKIILLIGDKDISLGYLKSAL